MLSGIYERAIKHIVFFDMILKTTIHFHNILLDVHSFINAHLLACSALIDESDQSSSSFTHICMRLLLWLDQLVVLHYRMKGRGFRTRSWMK